MMDKYFKYVVMIITTIGLLLIDVSLIWNVLLGILFGELSISLAEKHKCKRINLCWFIGFCFGIFGWLGLLIYFKIKK